ncbi:hypothetical protein CNMCM6805_006816 [Aspergillus fumigatiaffinis]|uniref:Uncharacterized protein n=1 Tax=Aspergillus fumigatiaffinis TaxID=340414 RepID=A0A8H4H7J3_9EURO|nr:hypothetical protein CNMCM5878_009538 [Aspergillus fumigatiaffinis]KAF4237759.1 hypothetical protein CNMCM6805_006816 [Aspergillus fumigatiaffinis]
MSAANGLYHKMLMLTRQFPALILHRDFCSHLVHHHVYSGSLSGMAKPLGIALACVSAHASSAESHANDGFVDRMITQQREKLVRNFHLYTDTPEKCLAALHAVCIYPILELFGPSEGRREEFERRPSCIMTRRLYNLPQKRPLVHHEHENDWPRWLFTESLRRKVFFVHMINILGARARKLNEDYFEPLGDEMVLHLSLWIGWGVVAGDEDGAGVFEDCAGGVVVQL